MHIRFLRLVSLLSLALLSLPPGVRAEPSHSFRHGWLHRPLIYAAEEAPYGKSVCGATAFERNVLRDLAYAGRTTVSDVGHVYSAPFRINRRSALLLGGILVSGGVIYAFDEEIYNAFQRNRDYFPLDPLIELGEELEPAGRQAFMNKYIFTTMTASYILGVEPLALMTAEIFESLYVAGIFKTAVNAATGRSRPICGRGPRWFKPGTGASFFSGHSSHAWQMARIISHRTGFLPLSAALYTTAFAMTIQRASSGWHWPVDVYIGAIYGFVVADALVKRHDRQWISVQPAVSPDGSAQGASLIIRL